MGIIGRVRQALSSRYKTGVVFTHVQKCGGSSLESALFRRYLFSRERILPIESRQALRAVDGAKLGPLPEAESFAFRRQLLAYALRRGVKCVTGHNPVSPTLRETFAPDWKFITVLREPVERFCSHLRYSYNSGLESSAGDDIDAFLDSPRARWFGAMYLSYFGDWFDVGEQITQDPVDKARALILSYDAVGFLDQLSEFQNDVCKLLGVNIAIGHENKTTERATSWRGDFTDKQLEKITSLCRPNIEVYGYVRERLGV